MIRNEQRRPFQIVNKSHQYRFLATILIYNFIIVSILAIALFVPDIIKMQDHSLSIEVRAMAADKILTLHSRIWPAIISLICVIGLHSFKVFHRFVGPLYRFTIAFKEVRDGNLYHRVKLRKKDHLHQEAAMLNEMFDVISEKLGNIQAMGQDTLQALNKFEQDINKKAGQIVHDLENMTEIRERLKELVISAGYFKMEK